MNIAVIGMGVVGGTLGQRFAEAGHTVAFGVQNPSEKVKSGTPPDARVMSVADAAREAEIIVLAVPWAAVPSVARELQVTRRQVLVDVVNPLKMGPHGLSIDAGPHGESGAERLAAMVPDARVVKAFNTTGAENMADPVYDGAQTVMFFAGDDADAKAIVRSLVTDLGFDPVDAGPLSRSRELEHHALLWISLSQSMGRNIAFRLVRRQAPSKRTARGMKEERAW